MFQILSIFAYIFWNCIIWCIMIITSWWIILLKNKKYIYPYCFLSRTLFYMALLYLLRFYLIYIFHPFILSFVSAVLIVYSCTLFICSKDALMSYLYYYWFVQNYFWHCIYCYLQSFLAVFPPFLPSAGQSFLHFVFFLLLF